MRTTVRIDDQLYRRVKEVAVRTGRTVGEVIEDAVRHALHHRPTLEEAHLPDLPTYGGSGVLPGVDLASGAALRDAMEMPQDLDALR